MQILVTGATGFVGQHLVPFLRSEGHSVRTVSRKSGADFVWDPDKGTIDPEAIRGLDAIVHLAGEQVAERWTNAKKQRIESSRVRTGALLSKQVAEMAPEQRPRVILSASAIGYYGDRGAEVLDETAPPGRGFLSKVCVAWEEALKPAADAGVRTLSTRMGVVLSTAGGAMPRVMRGMVNRAGGKFGSGHQYMSWITIEDAVSAILFLLQNESASGAYNVVAPQAVTNEVFVATLAEVMHCGRLIPVPAMMAQVAFGSEMTTELLLSSIRCVPERLGETGFQFKNPSLQGAVEHLIRDKV